MTEIERLLSVMRALRAPDGCPWDRAQTHETLKKCLLEETAEYMDAVDNRDDANMKEELGDVLMQVVLNSVIAEERKAFSFDDVARDVTDKMIRRHPHVFGGEKAETASEVVGLWDKIKSKEADHVRKSLMDGIPCNAPALLRAEKMQKRATKIGFDWKKEEDVFAKIGEELSEVREAIASGNEENIDEECGDLLFAIVNLIRFRGKCAEELLAKANKKFSSRFRHVEKRISERPADAPPPTLEEMDAFWDEAKKAEISVPDEDR